MSTVVISQPMLFPWVGLLEQIALADVYVHHTDIQFSRSSFVNRVQLKAPAASSEPTWSIKWLNIPVRSGAQNRAICDLEAAEPDWRRTHLRLLDALYRRCPHGRQMLAFVESIYEREHADLCAFLVDQLETTVEWLGIAGREIFRDSRSLGLTDTGSDRVLSIIERLGGTRYVTGHGARNYLDHEEFAARGITVEYLDYAMTAYPQPHGDFTPFVSVLDLIANVGRDGALGYIRPRTTSWQEFCARSAA